MTTELLGINNLVVNLLAERGDETRGLVEKGPAMGDLRTANFNDALTFTTDGSAPRDMSPRSCCAL